MKSHKQRSHATHTKRKNNHLLMLICSAFGLGAVLLSVGIFAFTRNSRPIAESGVTASGTTTAAPPTSGTRIQTTAPTAAATTTEKPPQTTAAAVTSGQPFDNLSSLSGTNINWGQGTKFDTLNRPVYAVTNEQRYGEYGADFIKPDTTKTLYLTFDEGYENGYTAKILDVLKEKKAPAVFFVTKPYAVSQPALVKRMIAEGHIVGNHSVTHPSAGLPSQTLEEQKNEVMGCHDYVKENFNYTMSLFRFPEGKFSVQSLALVHNCGYRSVFWSFAYLDYDVKNQMDEKQALELITSRLHPGAIYLLHAVSKTNTDILGAFIDNARAQGYTTMRFQ